jgi:hypothetical protein
MLFMNTELLATFESLLTIVTPLLILYLRGQWPLRVTVLCVLTLPVLWYLTYSPLHELSHVVGTYLVGGKVTYVKLIPRFWAGEFSRAWITTEGIEKNWQLVVSTGFPYMIDVVSAVIGYYLLRGRFLRRPFILGVAFMLLCLRPTFDLICETVAYHLGGKGDIYHIANIAGPPTTWGLALAAIALCCLAIAGVLRTYGNAATRPAPVADAASGAPGS